IKDNIIEKQGSNRYPNYQLVEITYKWEYLNQDLEEHILWTKDLSPLLGNLNNNIKDVCQYGFTEMANNVIDHSNAKKLSLVLLIDYLHVGIRVIDNGIGIFRKIKNDLGLEHSKHAILELAKGKFTSDPDNHTGEGIFFTSRIFDYFIIESHKLTFVGLGNDDGIFWEEKSDIPGTSVSMRIKKDSQVRLRDIFNEYADPDKDPSFHKTLIPVKLMEHEGESLLSRSQAKRLITRFDRFIEVVLDFDGVKQIGQAFADQIFRVFANKHPDVNLVVMNTTKDVDNMIRRVQTSR
ncbi:STAS-like domain-containing protein, partial [Desulfobacterales bacterium HSG17]|nr:STAS-like domain-containing protein [Desulfobacterales bacterium HSG17]